MYEKILSALRTKYANLGLSNEILEGVAKQLSGFVKEETEIDAVVAGAEATLKTIQSFGDKRATSEAERVKKELENKPEEKKEEIKVEEMPAWAKAIVDKVGSLETGLNNFNADRQSQTLSQTLTGIFAEKKVPESYYKAAVAGRTFKDEAEVTALADLVTTQFEAFKQDTANTGFSFTTPPEQGKAPKSDTDEIANMIATGTKEIIVEQSKK